MEGLVFLVVIVVFSILESVLKKRKAAQARLHGEAPESLEDALERIRGDDLHAPTYDAHPSYDDDASYDDGPSYDEGPSYDDQIDDESLRKKTNEEKRTYPEKKPFTKSLLVEA